MDKYVHKDGNKKSEPFSCLHGIVAGDWADKVTRPRYCSARLSYARIEKHMRWLNNLSPFSEN
jgi:hypothetical protein